MTIEEYLKKPYWVIDILPKQVSADSKGQYFRSGSGFLTTSSLNASSRWQGACQRSQRQG